MQHLGEVVRQLRPGDNARIFTRMWKPRYQECKNGRSSVPIVDRTHRSKSPTIECPIAWRWTRIWCVLFRFRGVNGAACTRESARAPESECEPRDLPVRCPFSDDSDDLGRLGLDHSSFLPNAAVDERRVLFVNRAAFHLIDEVLIGGIGERDDHQSRRTFVEAIDNSSEWHSHGKSGIARQQRIRERIGEIPGAGCTTIRPAY